MRNFDASEAYFASANRCSDEGKKEIQETLISYGHNQLSEAVELKSKMFSLEVIN